MSVSINNDDLFFLPKQSVSLVNGSKRFENDNAVLIAMANVVTAGKKAMNDKKIEIYGWVRDMAIRAQIDAEYNESLLASYEKKANKNTRANPAALIIGNRSISDATGGYKTRLRELFNLADKNNYTGEQLVNDLRNNSIKSIIARFNSAPETSSSPKKTKKDEIITTGDSNANVAVASTDGGAVGANSVAIESTVTTSVADSPIASHMVDIGPVITNSAAVQTLVSNTIVQPVASNKGPILPYTEFKTEYKPEAPFNQETIYVSSLKNLSGPLLLLVNGKRGHVVIGQVNISPMTTVHETDADNNPNILTGNKTNTIIQSETKTQNSGQHGHIVSERCPTLVTVHPRTGRPLKESKQYYVL